MTGLKNLAWPRYCRDALAKRPQSILMSHLKTEKRFVILLIFFLDAPLHLYMRVCPSVRMSVHPYVRPSVCPSIRMSIRPPPLRKKTPKSPKIIRKSIIASQHLRYIHSNEINHLEGASLSYWTCFFFIMTYYATFSLQIQTQKHNNLPG